MDKKTAQVSAKLKWEAACERLAFALNPPPGLPAGQALDLETALGLVQDALQEIREAFSVQ